MIRSADIAWLAGLLEGEGAFGMSDRSLCVKILMTDRDIIERAAALLRGHTYTRRAPKIDRPRKPAWVAQVKGPWAAGWMMTIYKLQGASRPRHCTARESGSGVRVPPKL